MPLSYMEHFLLQTEDIEATKDWYVKILGFRVGPAPDFKFPVYWLYLGDRDVLHITTGGKNVSENRKKYVGQQSEASAGTGVIDHVGFRTTGLHEMIEHLTKNKINFTRTPGQRPGAVPAFPVRPERREDRAQLRQRRGEGPHAAAQGIGIEPGDELSLRVTSQRHGRRHGIQALCTTAMPGIRPA